MSEFRAAVLTVSDRASRGEYEDRSGPRAAELLADAGFSVSGLRVVPDGVSSVKGALIEMIEDADLVVTCGGTGLSPRDLTPEATLQILERRSPGIAEAMRAATFGNNPHGMLSRGVAGTVGRTLVVNLPGSVTGVEESLSVVLPALEHGLRLLVAPQSDHH